MSEAPVDSHRCRDKGKARGSQSGNFGGDFGRLSRVSGEGSGVQESGQVQVSGRDGEFEGKRYRDKTSSGSPKVLDPLPSSSSIH